MLNSVVGHEELKKQITKLSSSNSTAHAFLFTGPKAIGKRLLAHCFAQLLFENRSRENHKYISELFSLGSHPDFHLLSLEPGKRDIPVESVRELCLKLQLKPYYKGPAVCVLDNAHRMSIAACNAFLKTLEEPAGHSFIFLVTDSLQQLPETIVSRCQIINCNPLTQGEVREILSRLTADQNLAEKLSSFSPDSLALFDLEQFVNPLTLEVTNQKELIAYLSNFESRLVQFAKIIDRVLDEDQPHTRAAKAVVAVSELTQDKSEVSLSINILKQRIRTRMRKVTDPQQINDFSNLLLKTVEAEQLIKQRTLNPQLQLSALFC